MKEQGITVAFYDQAKRNKRMKAYQEYIDHILAKNEQNENSGSETVAAEDNI